MTDKIAKTDEEWKSELTNEEYEVCRMKGVITTTDFSGLGRQKFVEMYR